MSRRLMIAGGAFLGYAIVTMLYDSWAFNIISTESSIASRIMLCAFGPILALGPHGLFPVFLSGAILTPVLAFNIVGSSRWASYLVLSVLVWFSVGFVILKTTY